jgi:pilus assembly protein CpaE
MAYRYGICNPNEIAMMNKTDTQSNSWLVAMISPDARRRQTFVGAIAALSNVFGRGVATYPSGDELTEFVRMGFEVAIVDLDHDTDRAINAIESISRRDSGATVMAYSASNDLALVRRAMKAGARDFLTGTNITEALREAFTGIAPRRARQEKEPGKLFVFASSKPGVGVTCAATNFALALSKESGARVVIVDMDLHQGDVALGLGLTPSASVADALANHTRLDREFLSGTLLRHSSGLSVLAAPEKNCFSVFSTEEGTAPLIRLLREEFDYIVIDSGSCRGRVQEKLIDIADKVYLITELSFPALRNGHRLIAHLDLRSAGQNLEVVLNRSNSKANVTEDQARQALRRPIAWRIPNGQAAMRAAWEAGTPLSAEQSTVMKALTQMAKAACGKPAEAEKTNRFLGLFDFKARPAASVVM